MIIDIGLSTKGIHTVIHLPCLALLLPLLLLLLGLPDQELLLSLQERFEIVLFVELTEDVHGLLECNGYAGSVLNIAR